MLAIYCRISRDEGNVPNRSIGNQKDFGTQLANKENMPYKFYIDENVSGTASIGDRPQFSKMLNAIIDGKIKGVFATEQDRLERNPQVRFVLQKIMKESGTKLFLSSGEVDVNNLENELIGDLVSVLNKFYADITSRKIKNVLKNNASKGIGQGIMPYGYCMGENKMMMIDEEEKKIVKRIYAMSLSGIGTNKIAQVLSDEGVPTRYNKLQRGGTLTIINKYTKKEITKNKSDIKWSGKTIQGIIKNKVYIGIRIHSGEKHECPAIFEEWYWKNVNDNLKKNRNNSGKSVTHKYMLKGVIECGGCGRNMYGRTRTNKKDNFYTCSGKRYKHWNCNTRSINIDILEDFIWSMFFEKEELLKLIQGYFDRDAEEIDRINREIEDEKGKIVKLEKEKANAIRLAVQGFIKDSDISSEVSRVNNSITDSENIISELKEELSTFDNSDEMLQQLKSLNTQQNQVPSTISWNDKSALINKYIKRIKVTSNDKLKLYNIGIQFIIPIKDENFVLNYFKERVPYVDLLKSIQVLPKSKDWKDRWKI